MTTETVEKVIRCTCGRVLASLEGVPLEGKITLPTCKKCKRRSVVDLTTMR